MSTIKAKVVWFDRRDGEALVRGLNGEGTAVLYACNIPGKKTLYPSTACVYYDQDQEIEVEVSEYGLLVARPGIVDDACHEYGVEASDGIMHQIMVGQAHEKRDVLRLVLDFLRERAEGSSDTAVDLLGEGDC